VPGTPPTRPGVRSRSRRLCIVSLLRGAIADRKSLCSRQGIELCADGFGDVLDGLRVVQRPNDLPLLGMWLSVCRRVSRIMCSLHACDGALAAGAGRKYDAWHMLLVVAIPAMGEGVAGQCARDGGSKDEFIGR